MGCPAQAGAISAIIPATATDQSRHYDCGGRGANGASTTLRFNLHYERRAASRNILLMAAPTARLSPAYRTKGRAGLCSGRKQQSLAGCGAGYARARDSTNIRPISIKLRTDPRDHG